MHMVNRPHRWLVGTALAMAGLLVAAGCSRGGKDEVPEDIVESKIDVSFLDDRGVAVDAFEAGDAVFASIRGLSPRTAYTVRLLGPGAPVKTEAADAESAEEAAKPEVEGAPPADASAPGAPAGPSAPPSATDAPTPMAQPSAGADPADAAGSAPAPPAANSEEEAGSADAGTPDGIDDPTGEPEAAAAGSADEERTAPPVGTGPEVASFVLMTDNDGAIPPTLVARAIGQITGSGVGSYTLSVGGPGQEIGSGAFGVTEGSRPTVTASDASGSASLRFAKNDSSVWVTARRLTPNTDVAVYLVEDRDAWDVGVQLDPANGRVVEAHTDASGKALVEVWPAPDATGAFDVVVDVDNDGAYSAGDAVNGVRTVGFVVYEEPLTPEETDLTARLACAEDVYSAGARAAVASDEGLWVRGAPLVTAPDSSTGGVVYVCAHRDAWENGAELRTLAPGKVDVPAVDPTAVARALVWPAPILPGEYDVIVDVNRDGLYTRGVDLLDAVSAGESGVTVADAGNLATVRGRVVDESGAPVVGASVACVDSGSREVTTDDKGEFVLTQVLPVATRVTIVAPGYAPADRTLTPEAGDADLSLEDVVVSAAAGEGTPYFPLVDGGEWKYNVDRAIVRNVTVGTEATTESATESGTILRGLARRDGGFTLTETEDVFVDSDVVELSGESSRPRTIPLVISPDGIALGGDRAGLWSPMNVEMGAEFAFVPLPIGDFEVWGPAVASNGGTVETEAGDFASCMLVTLEAAFGTATETGKTTATGIAKIWFAPDVGEVKREVDVELDIMGEDESTGRTRTGSIHITETLELVSVSL